MAPRPVRADGNLTLIDDDLLPGHIWVDQPAFLVENMKYFCPTVLDSMVKERQAKIDRGNRLFSYNDDTGELTDDSAPADPRAVHHPRRPDLLDAGPRGRARQS